MLVPLDDGSLNQNKWPQSKEERIMFEWVKHKCTSCPKRENSYVKTPTIQRDQPKEPAKPPPDRRVPIKPDQVCV